MMASALRRALLGFLAVIAASNAAQVPLERPRHEVARISNSSSTRWRFDVPLSSTGTTSNLVFDSVSSLLQQWGNTRFRNGHTIVPATIPVGTLLYHGTWRHEIPTQPEWVATDPEHSYAFCRDYEEDSCWLLTLAVTAPLNMLYFDGSSGAKMYGTMDAQDLIVFGDIVDSISRNYDEEVRINRLCEWGRRHYLDGFVRMQMDFEVMLCNFKRNVKVVSFDRLAPGFPALPAPGGPPPGLNITHLPTFRIVEAGGWHNHFPGETRINLDLFNLISFYDTDMAPSLVRIREGQDRFQHRAGLGLSAVDKGRFLDRLDEVVRSRRYSRSHINWASIYRVVVHRYGERLEVLEHLLNQTQSDLVDIVEYVETMISPYLLHDANPPHNFAQHPSHSWAEPIFQKCATTHTRGIIDVPTLTYSEHLLLKAVNEVLHEICRVFVGMWAEGVELGLSAKKPVKSQSSAVLGQDGADELKTRWHSDIVNLISWLDWSPMVKCRPECSFEEMCYMPTWPFFHADGRLPYPGELTDGEQPNPTAGTYVKDRLWGWVKVFDAVPSNGEVEDEAYWKKPQPKCLRRVAPLQFPF